MTEDEIRDLRNTNREIMTKVLGRLGSQDFRGACALLAEDVRCDWPYPPMEDSATEIRGRANVEEFFSGGMVSFEPYRYEITSVFDLVDPNCLIAEYHSNSRFLPSGAPYRNDYLGIFHFEGGLVSYWREYINPVVVANVLATAKPL
jgi:ketosteroid isomerase-like protein